MCPNKKISERKTGCEFGNQRGKLIRSLLSRKSFTWEDICTLCAGNRSLSHCHCNVDSFNISQITYSLSLTFQSDVRIRTNQFRS